jgi:hypothetical protein
MNDNVDRLRWFCGDQSALQLYDTLVSISHTWDDLIDQDKPLTKQDINGLMAQVLVSLPSNLFYRKHLEILQPLIVTSVISYIASTRLETADDMHKLELAHVLRYSIHQVVIMMMALTGGFQHAVDTTTANMHIMVPETFSTFYKEHLDARQ